MRMTTDTLIGQFLTVGVMLGAVVRCSVLGHPFSQTCNIDLVRVMKNWPSRWKQIENLVRNDDLDGTGKPPRGHGSTAAMYSCSSTQRRLVLSQCLTLDFFKTGQ